MPTRKVLASTCGAALSTLLFYYLDPAAPSQVQSAGTVLCTFLAGWLVKEADASA